MSKHSCSREVMLAVKLLKAAKVVRAEAETAYSVSASERVADALIEIAEAKFRADQGRCHTSEEQLRRAAGLIGAARRWLKRGTPTRRYARREDAPVDPVDPE